jgi:signal transduction histidine kinase
MLDRGMFERIVINLLSNALKFTPAGGRVGVRLYAKAGNLELALRDTGPGIPLDRQAFLFQRFAQVDNANPRRREGIGIGLSLVKEFAQLMGGRVWVESQVGTGSCFFVELPHRHVDGVLSAAVSAPAKLWPYLSQVPDKEVDLPPRPAVASRCRPVVLFVEDNVDMLSFVVEILGAEYEVELARNGRQALAKLKTSTPEVIVTDLMMPEMDGFEFIAHLKRDEKLKRIPVIALTARASSDELAFGLHSGADDYLAKPFAPVELKGRVYAAQRMRALSLEVEMKKAALEEALSRERETREELIQVSKMAAMGTLVSGLAHELNNPLAAILMYTKGLRVRLSRGESEVPVQTLEAVERQAHRCVKLVLQLLAFARKKPARRDRVTLSSVLEVIEVLARAQAQKLKVELKVDGGSAASDFLDVDVASFETALLNLLTNGLQATRSGGGVQILAHHETRDEIAGVEIRVIDNGVGIPPELLSRIFDPFFTTKAEGEGTGLGLSLVRAFADAHGGQINVDSELGKGTSVSLWLPSAGGAAAAVSTAAIAPVAARAALATLERSSS